MSNSNKRLFIIVAAVLLTFSAVAMVIALQHSDSLLPNSADDQTKLFKGKDGIIYTNSDTIPALTKDVTVLFCGVDLSKNLTDVISLVRIDTQEHKIHMLQIPRDTFIGKDYTTGKINSIYNSEHHEKSIKKLRDTIEEQFMIPIDYYAMVDLSVVEQVVDKVGGVEVDVPRIINYEPGKVLYPGKQVLSGDKSIWMIRTRNGYANADLGRLNMQKEFLYSAFNSVKKIGKLKAASIATEFFPKIKTDISLSQGVEIINSLLNMDQGNITTSMIPGEGTYYKDYAVYVVDAEKLVPILNDFLLSETPITEDKLKIAYPPKITVEKPMQESSVPY